LTYRTFQLPLNNWHMRHLLLFFTISISLTLNAQTPVYQSPGTPKSPGGEAQKNARYSFTIIPAMNKTWGYDIYLQDRLFIHQPNVPGLPGNEGFKTKTDAKKEAGLVIGKINKGEKPPCVTAPAPAPDSWTQKETVGGIARQTAVGFSIGNKGYIGTGVDINNNYYNDFWEYDPSTDVWTQKANFGGTSRHSAVGFSIGDKGYIGTGQDISYAYRNDFWEYDPGSNTWTQKADFGGTARWQAVGFGIGTKGYLGTGYCDVVGGVSDFWEYDPSSDSWTQKADFGGGIRHTAVGFSIGYKGYIGTGITQQAWTSKDFWEFDPSTNAWTQKADFGGIARRFACGFSIGAKGYIGTGLTDPNLAADFWEYNITTDAWTQRADFGGGEWVVPVGFCIGTKGYIGTGVSILTGTSNDFWEYTPLCPSPPPPTNTTPGGNLSICSGNSTTLTASGTGTLGWYDSPIGGTWLGGGGTFITPILTANTTYYVQDSTDCGQSATRTGIAVIVNPVPPAPDITCLEDTLHSSAPEGNQWYFQGALIAGATSQDYVPVLQGIYWDIVTLNGCSSDTSNNIWLFYGIDSFSSDAIKVYPVPNNGRFNISIITASEETFSIRVYNYHGAMIREEENVVVRGSIKKMIDLGPVPGGIYTVILENGQNQVVKKIMVN
jgi:hypothetical protein